MTTPILDAITILRTAVYTALDALTTSGVYWTQAPSDATRSFVVFQSQDLGGTAEKTVGRLDWSGLVTVKAIADTQAAAESLISTVAPGMNGLTYTGYTITTEYMQPVVIPPNAGVWQAAHQWRVYISRA